jgi:hypothetical protein
MFNPFFASLFVQHNENHYKRNRPWLYHVFSKYFTKEKTEIDHPNLSSVEPELA